MDTTAEDARTMFAAMLNQIPDTMAASRLSIAAIGNLTAAAAEGGDSDVGLKHLKEPIMSLCCALTYGIVALEDRLERLAGRRGVDLGRLAAVMPEFFG